jgi:RNA polymerase-binding transcription factor DksA
VLLAAALDHRRRTGEGCYLDVAQIEAALHRLDDGTWGVCERCGNKIAGARMEALPTATRCVECAAIRR